MESGDLATVIANHLAGLMFYSLTSHQVTRVLTDECRLPLEGVGYTTFHRAFVSLYERADGRNGRLDLVAEGDGTVPGAAIEIDRGNKRWSLCKLRDASDAGWLAVWVLGALTKEVPGVPGVGVVTMQLARTAGVDGRPVWSH